MASLALPAAAGLEPSPGILVVGALLAALTGAAVAAWALHARRRAARSSRSDLSAAQFMSLVHASPDILIIVDETGRVIEASATALGVYGYTIEELRRLVPGALKAGATESAPSPPAESTGAPGSRIVTGRHRRQDGSTFPVEVRVTPVMLAEGRCQLHSCRDISQTDERQQQLDRVSQLYRILRQLNQAMVRADSRDELEQSVCDALVKGGRFKVAWIAWKDAEGPAVHPSASAGEDLANFADMTITVDDATTSRSPIATAIRENRACVSTDFKEETRADSGRPLTTRDGLRASIALPLRTAKGAVGALSVHAPDPGTFDREEVMLLEQCAADFCFALENLDDAASHRLAEERLVLLGSALEGAPSAIAISDQNDTIEWVNPAFVANSGFTLDEVVGRNSRQLRSEHQPTVSESELWRTISTGHAWHGELISRRKNGQLYIEDTSILPVRDRNGRIRNFVSLRQDVTGRKGAEQRVREQAALLDQASEAIVVADLNHRVTFWNRGAERLFGFRPVEALGRQLKEVFSLETTIGSAEFQHAITVPHDWRGEIRVHDRQGEPLVIETSITMLLDDGGRPTGRLYFSADVTKKKALEEQFLRVQRMENIGMLAAGIAHDLNNILAPMRMVGPLLRDRLVEARDLKLLDTLETCAIRGAALVRQILGFAQGVSGEPRMVQVKHLLRDVVDVITATFPKSIVLEEEIPTDLWPINGNPTQIHQVLLNLCVNARDAMPDGGTLRLRAHNRELNAAAVEGIEGAQPGPWLVIDVEDSGTGITSEVLAHMWEPLYTTKAADKGTGLGLSTVRGIVAQHHGFITVATEIGRGSTFRVHFPADRTNGEAEGADAPAAKAPAKGELVLFVDDEPTVRDVANAALTRHGYRVMTASDGAEAIAQFAPHATEIALVITDIDMPNFDGVALCRVIHTLSPKTKLLVISGLSTGAPNDPPGVAFLAKPFGVDALLQKADELLHGRTELPADNR